ncbi:MAG: ABC transporter ATP-binding protein [Spirochaetales bacterium]|nr:ABC transporter ATP-binding protein [Spirochaetales bacterium]
MSRLHTSEPFFPVLFRLSGYLWRYRIRLTIGVLLALFVSMANLVSLTLFVPVFNSLGTDSPAEVLTIGGDERVRFLRYQRGEAMPLYDRMGAWITSRKVAINEHFSGQSSRQIILTLCFYILPIYLLKLLGVTLTIFFAETAGLLAVRDLRSDLYRKLNEMDLNYFSEHQTGSIMSNIVNDSELVGKSVSAEFTDSLMNFFYIITHAALLVLISWQWFLVIFVGLPLFLSPINNFARKIRRVATGQQDRLAEMGSHLQEVISGIRVIRAFSMETFEKKRFAAINDSLYKNTYKGHYYHQVGPAITEFISAVVGLGFLAWGAYEISRGLDKGLFFAFFFILIFIMRPLKQISVMINLINNSVVAARRIFSFLDTRVDTVEKKVPLGRVERPAAIEYRNVFFQYKTDGAPVLEDIHFFLPGGQTLAIVGQSGAGKTTLMDLLSRFYDPVRGAVLINGLDVRNYSLKTLRTSIGVVTQSIFLFNASIKDNISFGRPDTPLEKIVEAATLSYADEFIRQMPQGYDTLIGERGVMLSGGQRQRLAIARALLHDPPILIFDEATSSLDNESELMVQRAIETLLRGRTVFLIAHRLSTIRNADQIIVMDRGRIVEQGKHTELMAVAGPYKKLHDMQFGADAP